jgi:glucose-1-phosphate cytidylyltransferase
MKRELPRTLYSMYPAFQQVNNTDEYEVILTVNGSKEPPTADDFAHLDMNLSVYSMPNPTHSPVAAINFGLNQAIGQCVGVCIDGARLLSPGLIMQARNALSIYERGVVGTRGRYLGVKFQRDAMNEGYNAQQEDALLAQCQWKVDGYRLFDISVFDESCGPTWVNPIAESNALFMSRTLWKELGGFDARFESRGGGLVNLDTWSRAISLPNANPILLLGEATFHQIHGGVATNGTHDVIKEFFANYFLHTADVTIDLRENSMEVHRARSEPWRITMVETGADTMTGGRLKAVKDFLTPGEPFCFTYGDGVADIDVAKLVAFHKAHGRKATITAVAPPGRFGALELSEQSEVLRFKEKPAGDGGLINGGFFIADPSVVDLIAGPATVWEQEPLETLAATRELVAYHHSGFWQPMDTLRDKQHLEELWLKGKAPWKLW